MTSFTTKTQFFATYIKKCNKVTSDIHHRRKFLRPKIGSHGTPLGYLGPVSQKGQDRIFSKPHFLFILYLNEFPTPQKSFLFKKNLKSFATWCVSQNHYIKIDLDIGITRRKCQNILENLTK